MNSIFSLDGAFFKYMSLVADVIILSAIFTVICIPIITIGPATTAMFYVMTRRIHEKEAYVIRDFFKSFKSNFVQSTLTWLLLQGLMIVLGVNILSVLTGYVFSLDTLWGKVLLAFYFLALIEVIITSLYVYPIISRFELKFIPAIKTALLLANKHMPSTISIGCLAVLIGYLTIANPFLIAFSMGIYAALTSYFFMKIFRKYNPTIDLDAHEISYAAINELKEKLRLEDEEKEKNKNK